MSVTFNRRKKLIKRCKKRFGRNWYGAFRSEVAELVKKREGTPVRLSTLMGLDD